jgi:hypothetical protein
MKHPSDALTRVGRLGRGAEGGCTEQFVSMFANRDSLSLPADVRTGLQVLCRQVVDEGLAATVPPFDVVDSARRSGARIRS